MNQADCVLPIFIVGMPRSGTTLLQSLLNQHKDIAVAPETHFLATYMGNYKSAKECIRDYTSTRLFGNLHINETNLLLELNKFNEWGYKEIFDVILKLYAKNQNKTIYGEKTPGHYEHLDVLFDWYPRARVIWVVRDPRAVAASYRHVPWGSGGVVAPALRWRGSMQEFQRWKSDKRIIMIKYEDIVNNTEIVLERIFSILNLEKPPVDQIHKNRQGTWVDVKKSSQWEKQHFKLASAPIFSDSISKWRKELTESEVAMVEFITHDGMKQMGYTPYSTQNVLTVLRVAMEIIKIISKDPKSILRKIGLIQK